MKTGLYSAVICPFSSSEQLTVLETDARMAKFKSGKCLFLPCLLVTSTILQFLLVCPQAHARMMKKTRQLSDRSHRNDSKDVKAPTSVNSTAGTLLSKRRVDLSMASMAQDVRGPASSEQHDGHLVIQQVHLAPKYDNAAERKTQRRRFTYTNPSSSPGQTVVSKSKTAHFPDNSNVPSTFPTPTFEPETADTGNVSSYPSFSPRYTGVTVTDTLSAHDASNTSSPSPCQMLSNDTDVVIDCSQRNIKMVSARWFPLNTTVLILDHNCIGTLNRGSFNHLGKLRYLSLRDNFITNFETGTFVGLHSLEVLVLENNELIWLSLITHMLDKKGLIKKIKGFLKPLTNLRELYVQYNFAEVKDLPEESKYNYLVYLVHPLTKLRRLSLDIFDVELVRFEKFSKSSDMTGFEHLKINFYGESLEWLTFAGLTLTGLIDLEISNAPFLRNISKDSLEPLRHLRSIKLANSIVSMSEIINNLMAPLTGLQMDVVCIDNVNQLLPCWIGSNTNTHLGKVCTESLSIRYSNLRLFDLNETVRNPLSRCVKHLDLTGNEIYMTPDVSGWEVIETLSISDTRRSEDPERLHIDGRFPFCTMDNLDSMNFTFNIAKTLTFLNQSKWNVYFFTSGMFRRPVFYQNAQSLVTLDLSQNGLLMVTDRVHGLENITSFYFSGNNLTDFTETFFDSLSNLEHLELSSCMLQNQFLVDRGERLFRPLVHLRYIDLSHNDLYSCPRDIFKNKGKLEYIKMDHNRFDSVPFDLSDTPRLNTLDLRNTMVTSLPKAETAALDLFNRDSKNLTLLLDGNLLTCSCSNIEFLVWLKMSTVSFDSNRNYLCVRDSARFLHTGDIEDISALWRQCMGKFFFLISLIILFALIIAFLGTILVDNYKTYLAAMMLKVLDPEFKMKTAKDYSIGVYLCYADADYKFPCHILKRYLEENLGLTTFLKHRDAVLPEADSIAYAVRESWRVLLLVTEHFLQDDWSWYAIQTALQNQTPANPDKILLVVEENVHRRVPCELLAAVGEDNLIIEPRLELSYTLRQTLRTRILTAPG